MVAKEWSNAVKTANTINSWLRLVMKPGKYTIGYKTTLKSLRAGKSKLALITNSNPAMRKTDIEPC